MALLIAYLISSVVSPLPTENRHKAVTLILAEIAFEILFVFLPVYLLIKSM
jgi:hypothetical protein